MERLTAEQLETFQLMVDTHGERAMTVLVSDLKALLSSHADAQRALDAEREKVAFLEKKNANLIEASNLVLKVKAEQDEQLATLQAQLRQVEGERDHAKKMEAVQKEVADNQTWHVRQLRQLVEALPVAGLPVEHARSDDFVVLQANGEWMVHTYNYWAKFATEDEARAYIALLEYRASLPAQPAQGGA